MIDSTATKIFSYSQGPRHTIFISTSMMLHRNRSYNLSLWKSFEYSNYPQSTAEMESRGGLNHTLGQGRRQMIGRRFLDATQHIPGTVL